MADERTMPDVRPQEVRRGESAPVAPAPPVAPPLLGRYQLLFELARGGMGVVHVARLLGAHGFDRIFALKQPLATGAPREEIASFLDEARLSAKVLHPCVVETIDLGEHEGQPYLVMLFVPGVSLARLLGRLRDRGELLDPWLVAWILREIASGLHAAHELRDDRGEPLGLVHRDVSPENVLLGFDGRALVTDFGVAKWRLAGRSTDSGVTKGKLAYMSPEQTRARGVDRRTDVFALGVVAHEALLGRRLFAGDSPAATIHRVLEHVPPDPREERPEVPAELAALVLRCLDKDPSRRPATAEEVALEIRDLLRRERRVVDSSDLGAALARAFPGERERLIERVERATRAAEASLEEAFYRGADDPSAGSGGGGARSAKSAGRGEVSGESASLYEESQASAGSRAGESHASVTAAAVPVSAPVGGRGRTLALALLGVGVLVLAALLFTRAGPQATGSPGLVPLEAGPAGATSTSGGTSTSGAPAATSAAVASSTAVTSSTAVASNMPVVPSVAASPGTFATPARPPARPSTSEAAPGTVAAPRSPAPSAAPTGPSKKGVPFKTLDL